MAKFRYRLKTLCLVVAILAVCLAGISRFSRMQAAAVRAEFLAAQQTYLAAERALVQQQAKVGAGSPVQVSPRPPAQP